MLYGRNDPESLLPYQPFIAALDHWVSHRERLDLPAELALELTEVARFVPGLRKHVPELQARRWRRSPRCAATGSSRASPGCSRSPPASARSSCCSTTCTGPTPSTTLLLGHLLQDAAPMRLFVLGTARTFEGELLARLRRQGAFEKLELGGLTAEETRALVARDDVTSQFVQRLTEETEGNPFFIEETLRSLPELEERALSRIAVPEGVKELIGRRLEQLSEPTNRVLGVASVVGRRFDLHAARDAAGRRRRARRARGGDRRAGSCARPGVDRFAFAHALVREALYESQSTSRRVRLHRRIGEALEADRRREPRRARLPLPRGPGAAGDPLRARRGRAGDRRAGLGGGGRALPARRRRPRHPARARRRRAARRRSRRPRDVRPRRASWPASRRTTTRWPRPRSGSPAATPRRA